VVAVFLLAITQGFAPGDDDLVFPGGSEHTTTLQPLFMGTRRGFERTPAVANPGTIQHRGLIDHMTMIGGQDDGPPRQPGLVEQGADQTQGIQVPVWLHLIRARQMVVHAVVDHGDNPVVGLANGIAHLFREADTVRKLALMENEGFGLGFGNGDQVRMAGKP